MAKLTPLNFTTPLGRLVAGSLYTPRTTDFEGRPLVYKTGQHEGKPRENFDFGVAIPKGPETHWANAEGMVDGKLVKWGAVLWQAGHNFIGDAGQNPDFAWKVTDGDSTVPNTKKNRPCDQEGYPGHWILFFSRPNKPKVYSLVGYPTAQLLTEPGAVNLGDYVQVNGDAVGNESTGNPGIYLNHQMLCLIAHGPRISTGPDVASAGFGGGVGALPPGASQVPTAAAAGALPAPPAAGVPGAPPPPPGAPAPAAPRANLPPPPGAPAPAAPANVQPNPAFTAAVVPPPPPGASAAPPPPAAVVYQVAPAYAAQNHTLESLRASGQTDAQMAAAGWLVAVAAAPAPGLPPPPPAAPPVPAPRGPSKVMTPAANGWTYDALIGTGQWTDETLVSQGLMQA